VREGLGGGDVLCDERLAVGGGSDGGAVLVKEVDLFKGEAFSLRDTEVREDETAETGGTPDEEDLDAEICVALSWLDEVGGGEGKSPIPEPVRGSGQRHSLGTNVKREDLASNDPCNRSPSGSEERDIDTGECHQNLLTRQILR